MCFLGSVQLFPMLVVLLLLCKVVGRCALFCVVFAHGCFKSHQWQTMSRSLKELKSRCLPFLCHLAFHDTPFQERQVEPAKHKMKIANFKCESLAAAPAIQPAYQTYAICMVVAQAVSCKSLTVVPKNHIRPTWMLRNECVTLPQVFLTPCFWFASSL